MLGIFAKKYDGGTWFEIVLTLTVSLLGLNSAMLQCWPSPFLVKIVKDERYDITEEQASYFTVISQIAVIILPPFIAPIANRIGRKKFILMTSIPYATSWIVKAFCKNLWLLYFARFVAGFGDAITLSCGSVYIGEVASPEVRGVWGNGLMCFAFLGQFLINLLGINFSIQVTSFISVTIPILFFVIFWFMPESPYYYISKGSDDEAKKCLRLLRRKENVDEEFKELKVAVANQFFENSGWKELITERIDRRALTVGIFLRLAHMFSGVYAFAAYTLLIFQKAGTNISPETSTLIFTGLSFVCYSFAVYGSNKLGRRKSLIISMVLTGIVLSSLGIYFLLESVFPEVNLEPIKWYPLAGMIAFLIASSIGVAIIPSLMLGEIFSLRCKSKALAVVTSSFGIMTFGMNNIFYYLNLSTGLCGPFLLLGLGNLISATITYYIVPETKNKTLEEVQQQLRRM